MRVTNNVGVFTDQKVRVVTPEEWLELSYGNDSYFLMLTFPDSG